MKPKAGIMKTPAFFGIRTLSRREYDLQNRAGRRGCWYINPARSTTGNELNRKTCRDNGAFVPNQMLVVPAIYQGRTICGSRPVYLWYAIGMILRYLPRRDHDQAVARMLMPAGSAANLPSVALQVQV